jgi:large subunit ribosomal protein L3
MSGLIGKKVGMTRLFIDGVSVPVTVVQAGPCTVVQIKNEDPDGYKAIQVGFEEIRESKANKPQKGHFKKGNVKPHRFLREFRVDNPEAYEVGQAITVDVFTEGQKLDVIGTTKGRGFSGAMKRWNFRGGERSHGSKFHRELGSIGQHSYPARIFPGKKMPGQYGNERVTLHNLEVVKIDSENNLVAIKGSIPGAYKSLVILRPPVRVAKKKIR